MESSMDLMEQKVHELDARLKQMKEERDQVIQDNEELQEQLDMTNTNNSVGKWTWSFYLGIKTGF